MEHDATLVKPRLCEPGIADEHSRGRGTGGTVWCACLGMYERGGAVGAS